MVEEHIFWMYIIYWNIIFNEFNTISIDGLLNPYY